MRVLVRFNLQVRPWKDELVPHVATMSNVYRPRAGEEDRIPHSFVFKRRESSLPQPYASNRCLQHVCIFSTQTLMKSCYLGLPPALELSQRLPRRYGQSAMDVFCLVKHDLCDTELAQRPLLVWPGDEVEKTKAF